MLLVPPKWTSDAKGQFFEAIVSGILKRQRYQVQQRRVRLTGMEIDILATNRETKERAFVECKFTQEPLSANVIDVLIGKSIRKNADLVFLYSTSPLNKDAQGILEEMDREPMPKSPRFAFIGPEKLADMLIETYTAGPASLPSGPFEHATLIISPDISPFWVTEREDSLAPLRLRPSMGASILTKDVKMLFDETGVFSGRPLAMEPLHNLITDRSDNHQLLLRRSGSISQEAIDALQKRDSDD
jgi:Holliday junction resolvase-like predicted endonuclease